jgi:uncharacterized protein YjdB
MSFISGSVKQKVRRWGWLVVCPLLAVCSGGDPAAPLVAAHPGTVSDLTVGGTTEVSALLSFTQVDDGMGQPAQYDVRYAAGANSLASATVGTCAAPLTGTGAGSSLSCSVLGLIPATAYTFQVVAFRGDMSANAVFGEPSNVATASTMSVTPPTPVATTVTVSPGVASLLVGGTSALQALVKDQNGNVMTGQTVSWSTSNAAAATVNSSGIVTGVAAGSATITATSSGKTGTSAVTVTAVAPVVTTVTVAPTSASILVGATTSLQAAVKDQNGNVMTGQTVSWSSGNSSAATVNSSGVVTGVAAGSATITATASGVSGTSAITVTAVPPVVTTVTITPMSASVTAGATTTLQATVKDQNGNVMTGQTVSWSTSNAAAATVNSTGVVTGVAAGSATITATSSGKTGISTVTVTAVAPVVTTVTVAPTSASIVVGATTTLQATVKDQNGNVMTGQVVTWSSSNSSAATVNSSGVVTGVAAGSATISATSSGKMGTSSVSVSVSSGGAVFFQENFEDGSLASRGWYDNTSVQLSTAEHIAGSNSSAQYHFLAGATSPTSGGAQRHKFTPSNSFYVSYYVKYSTNWVGSGQLYHPHEFYALSTLDGDYDGPSENFLDVYLEQNYQNGGRPRVAIQDNNSVNYSYGALPNNLTAVTESRSTGGCNGMVETNITSECFDFGTYWYNDKQLTGPVVFQPNPGAGYKNNWNFVEAYFQLNTIVNGIGQADGVVQYWFNGTLIIDRHDILYRTGAHPTLQFSQFLIAPYIGDGSPVDQSMFVDNLRVAPARIP